MHEIRVLVLNSIGCKNTCVFCGKTEYASKKLANKIARRNFIDIDIKEEYVEIAPNRIEETAEPF